MYGETFGTYTDSNGTKTEADLLVYPAFGNSISACL